MPKFKQYPANVFRVLRIIKGMNQTKWAEFLKVSSATVQGWEQGRHVPRFEIIAKFLELLDKDEAYLVLRGDIKEELINYTIYHGKAPKKG